MLQQLQKGMSAMIFNVLATVILVFGSAVSLAAPSTEPQEGNTGGKSAPVDPVALDNAYVRVLQDSSACGAAPAAGFGSRIIVALTGVTVQSGRGTLTLERGQIAVFRAGESYDRLTGGYFEIALKSPHPAIKGPEEWVEPQGNLIVYEDDQFRIFEERLGPGEDRALHSHAERIVVRLNEVQLTDPRTRPEGTPGKGIQVPNTVKFAEPIVHVVRNLSKIPLFNIVIEFKVPPQKG